MNRKDRRAQRRRRTEGKLLRPGTLHREGKHDTGCASCGSPVGGGVFFGATVSELYLADDTAADVKAAAQQANGRPVVFGMCPQCLLGKPRTAEKYALVLGTPPESLAANELAALMALPPMLTGLSNLPDFDPTDVTVQLSWATTGHVGIAKLEKPKAD